MLSLLALFFSGVGSFLINVRYDSATANNSTAEQVGDKAASGLLHVVSVLMGVPFLIAGIILAGVAILMTIAKLRKVKVTGVIISALWLGLSVWAVKIALVAFDLIRAK